MTASGESAVAERQLGPIMTKGGIHGRALHIYSVPRYLLSAPFRRMIAEILDLQLIMDYI
jgi:hypothetical protein